MPKSKVKYVVWRTTDNGFKALSDHRWYLPAAWNMFVRTGDYISRLP
jgi:hypothetical protein